MKVPVAQEALRAALAGWGATVSDAPNGLSAKAGSRFGYRMWGVYMDRSKKQLPLRASVTLSGLEDGGTAIETRVQSDEGWHLSRGSAVETAYLPVFDEILALVSEAAPKLDGAEQ